MEREELLAVLGPTLGISSGLRANILFALELLVVYRQQSYLINNHPPIHAGSVETNTGQFQCTVHRQDSVRPSSNKFLFCYVHFVRGKNSVQHKNSPCAS